MARVRIEEVAGERRAEVRDDCRRIVAADGVQLVERPDVELAFDPLGVGVLGGEEAAGRVAKVAEHVGDGLLDDAAVPNLTGCLPGVQVRADEQRLVVQHLLEVRDEPLRVDGVPVEPAADVVVDPATGHAVERADHGAEGLGVAGRGPLVDQERQRHGLGELRCPAEPAVDPIQLSERPRGRMPQQLAAWEGAVAFGELAARTDRGVQTTGVLEQLAVPFLPRVVDRAEQPAEAREAVALLLREVGPAVEGPAVGREEHRHRPTAAAGHRLHGLHVDGVDVGPFLAVDFHVDEVRVHERSGVRVLEGLVRHHMAPVACGVADGEEHGAILGTRACEGLLAPRIPVDRVLGVLTEVRAGRTPESVHTPERRFIRRSAGSYAGAPLHTPERRFIRRSVGLRPRRCGPTRSRACRWRNDGARRPRRAHAGP